MPLKWTCLIQQQQQKWVYEIKVDFCELFSQGFSKRMSLVFFKLKNTQLHNAELELL